MPTRAALQACYDAFTPQCWCAAYLGSDQPNFTLNFSKSASMIIGQYYQFVRLGFEGYKKIMASLLNVTMRLQKGIEALGQPLPRPLLPCLLSCCDTAEAL